MVNVGARHDVLASILHAWLMYPSRWCNFRWTLIYILFFNLSESCFSFSKSEVVRQHEFMRINTFKNFQYSVLMILSTEDNIDWNGQKNEQFSYAFTSSHSHSWGIKVINCFAILWIRWRLFCRSNIQYFS